MSGSEHDAELEAFLKRRSPIHRRLSDIDHAEPSIDLDRLVLTRAREAIDSPAQPPMLRSVRWAMPVGLAATILIAFTVVLNIDHRAPSVAKPDAAATAGQPAVPVAQLTANSSEPEASDAANAAPAPARERRNVRSEKQSETPPPLASTRAGYMPPLAPSLEKSSADVPPVAATTAAETPASEAESDSRALEIEQRRSRGLSGQPLLASGAAISTVSDRMAASPAPAPPPPPAAPPAYQASAETWLSEINRLRAAGKTAEAERELTAFRQTYPSHPGYSLARPPTR